MIEGRFPGVIVGKLDGREEGIFGRLEGVLGRVVGRVDGVFGRLEGIFGRVEGRLEGMLGRDDGIFGRLTDGRLDGRLNDGEEGLLTEGRAPPPPPKLRPPPPPRPPPPKPRANEVSVQITTQHNTISADRTSLMSCIFEPVVLPVLLIVMDSRLSHS